MLGGLNYTSNNANSNDNDGDGADKGHDYPGDAIATESSARPGVHGGGPPTTASKRRIGHVQDTAPHGAVPFSGKKGRPLAKYTHSDSAAVEEADADTRTLPPNQQSAGMNSPVVARPGAASRLRSGGMAAIAPNTTTPLDRAAEQPLAGGTGLRQAGGPAEPAVGSMAASSLSPPGTPQSTVSAEAAPDRTIGPPPLPAVSYTPACAPLPQLLPPSGPAPVYKLMTPRQASAHAPPSSSGQTQTPNVGKADKGLRHFSARVSAKVEQKGCTTYNEEIGKEMGIVGKFDHKNIRRRVYDALNVLMAIDVIRKDKKEIRWLGLPNDASQDIKLLETERAAVLKRVGEKRKALGDLVQRVLALKALIQRNQRLRTSRPDPAHAMSLAAGAAANDRLHLPFILINAPRDCRVHCEMLEDRTQYFFEFDHPFFINEDIEALKLMGLDAAIGMDEATAWLPTDLFQFYKQYLAGSSCAANAGLPVSCAGTAGHGNQRITVKSMRHSSNNNTASSNHIIHHALPANRPYMSSPGRPANQIPARSRHLAGNQGAGHYNPYHPSNQAPPHLGGTLHLSTPHSTANSFEMRMAAAAAAGFSKPAPPARHPQPQHPLSDIIPGQVHDELAMPSPATVLADRLRETLGGGDFSSPVI